MTPWRSLSRRMAPASLSRQRVVALAQVVLVSTLLARDAISSAGAAAVDAFEETVPLGSKQCPLDISVLWTADVDSPVYSTPVIRPSSVDGRKQLVLASLRNAVELLYGDGSVPSPWPGEMDGATFLASPALHDVNGDGIQDFCIADMEGLIHWLTPGGEGGPYLWRHRQQLPGLRVEKDYFADGREEDKQSRVAGRGGRAAGAGVAWGGETESEAEEGRQGLQEGGRRALLGLNEEPRRELGGEDPRVDIDIPVNSASEAAVEEGPGAYRDSAEAYADGAYWAGDYMAPEDTGGNYWASFTDDDGYGWNGASGTGGRGGKEFRSAVGHVLASPVFSDVNGDGQEEMIVPITYFFDRRMQDFSDLEGFSPETFVAGSLNCWDFKAKDWLWTYSLGQTKDEAEKEAFVYASPTVCDLDSDGALEIVVGTADGMLHVLDATTGLAKGDFPLWYNEIRGQVAVADVDGDGEGLDMLFGDASGVVACVKHDGIERWRRDLPGSIKSMVTLGDVDGDGSLDVVVGVTTVEGSGEVWALSTKDGLTLPHFPVSLGNRKGISNAITLVDLHENTAGTVGGGVTADSFSQAKRGAAGGGVPIGGRGPGVHLLAPSKDGHVYVIEGATGCVNKIDLGERVLSMVLADDLDGDGTLELVVGTASGEVVALSANVPFHPLNAWTSRVRGQLNGFVHGGYQGVHFLRTPSGYGDIVGRQFSLSFEIVDKSPPRGDGDGGAEAKGGGGGGGGGGDKPYKITISAGNEEVFHRDYRHTGVYTVTLSLESPRHALLRIEMTNGQRLYFEDHVFVGYNTSFHAALKWMLVSPVVLAALLFMWVQPASSRTHLPA